MRVPLLVEYYNEMPVVDDSVPLAKQAARVRAAHETFRKKVAQRYTEGTLLRLVRSPGIAERRAAVLALGLTGSMSVCKPLAGRLHDADSVVRGLAVDALWSVWFRGDTEANTQELQRLMRMRDLQRAMVGLDALIKKAPHFAEAYNQRAILCFRLHEYDKAIADCERVLKLNPYHFGALSGVGQCYMHLQKPRSALRAFRRAMQINPNMEGVQETIRALESVLGEEGKADDKK